jgi:hypothetical protein
MLQMSQMTGFNVDGVDLTKLVLWLNGADFVDHSMYNTTIDGTCALSGGYVGDGASSFETGSNASNFQIMNGIFTIEFSLTRASNAYGSVIGKTRYNDNATGVSNGWLIGMGTSGPMKFTKIVSGAHTEYAGTIIPSGAKHRCRFTYDGTNLRYYVDDALDATHAISPFVDEAVDLGIMAEDSWPGPPFLGYNSSSATLHELKIWKGVVLTSYTITP